MGNVIAWICAILYYIISEVLPLFVHLGYFWETLCWPWSWCMELWCYSICSSLWHPSFWWWKHPQSIQENKGTCYFDVMMAGQPSSDADFVCIAFMQTVENGISWLISAYYVDLGYSFSMWLTTCAFDFQFCYQSSYFGYILFFKKDQDHKDYMLMIGLRFVIDETRLFVIEEQLHPWTSMLLKLRKI